MKDKPFIPLLAMMTSTKTTTFPKPKNLPTNPKKAKNFLQIPPSPHNRRVLELLASVEAHSKATHSFILLSSVGFRITSKCGREFKTYRYKGIMYASFSFRITSKCG
ncbi:MAG: hypothetical protein GXN99_02510, partial [Candidatus Nanohaloarchaeota archaeon]|nr:hypothetical protein [Candidatus Nanohaloarchaeota archaeon]